MSIERGHIFFKILHFPYEVIFQREVGMKKWFFINSTAPMYPLPITMTETENRDFVYIFHI